MSVTLLQQKYGWERQKNTAGSGSCQMCAPPPHHQQVVESEGVIEREGEVLMSIHASHPASVLLSRRDSGVGKKTKTKGG